MVEIALLICHPALTHEALPASSPLIVVKRGAVTPHVFYDTIRRWLIAPVVGIDTVIWGFYSHQTRSKPLFSF